MGPFIVIGVIVVVALLIVVPRLSWRVSGR